MSVVNVKAGTKSYQNKELLQPVARVIKGRRQGEGIVELFE